jgi:hypothetical protein
MIWPKKASRFQYHISIVRANKREVNDYFRGDDNQMICELLHKIG